jgi:hypothetical protein
MRKTLALPLMFCVALTTAFAASKPKATGDASWLQPYNGAAGYASANGEISFNAIETSTPDPKTGVASAKGSMLYDDPYYTYSADIQFMIVSGKTAQFIGSVTSVTLKSDPTSPTGLFGCCAVGNWVYFEVTDVDEPGVGADYLYGEDLGAIGGSAAINYMVANPNHHPQYGPYVINDGNIQVH